MSHEIKKSTFLIFEVRSQQVVGKLVSNCHAERSEASSFARLCAMSLIPENGRKEQSPQVRTAPGMTGGGFFTCS
jgi:hypothetical protein